MIRRLTILLLIVGCVFAQAEIEDDIHGALINLPYFINHQNNIKDSFYKAQCKGEYLNVSEIENSVIPEFLLSYFPSKLSSIINTDNFYIEMDSISASTLSLKVEYKQNKYFDILDICKDEKLLNDIYMWYDIGYINYVKATIFTDYSIDIDLIESAVNGLISELFPHFDCNNCITYELVDINKFIDRKEKNVASITKSLNRDDIYDDSWAVIIGIDKYKYSDQLNYAVKDAKAVKDMLIDKFDYPEENIRYLTDEEATLSNIKLNLGEVATSAGEDDRILVFYSGHGETLKGADGSETGYIVPYEGKMENLYATGLAMDDILRTCQLSKSKHMLFLMDACYSGLMTENVKSLAKPIEQGYLSKVANEKARQIITAGGRDEQVIERDEWQHSAFTKNLLAGLDDWESDTDEDGYVTADELGTYLRISVTEDSDFQQTPQKGRFRNSGGGEFVFFSNHTAIKPKLVDQTAKSNGDDIATEKAVDMKMSWYEKHGNEQQGIIFMVLEETYQIGYTRNLNENWVYFFGYAHVGNNILKKVLITENSHSASANHYLMGLSRTYHFTDNVFFHIGGVASYMIISWKDIEQNISGDFNKIVPATNLGIAVSPFQFEKPFPMSLVVSVDIHALLVPKSYSETDGILMFADLQIKFLPGFLFHFGLPLPK